MRKRLDKILFIFWLAAGSLLAVNLVVFTIIICVQSPEMRLQYVPDDAFYYLTLSRNFCRCGLWSFDSGVSVTSGFHPLFAYLLSLLYVLSGGGEERFIVLAIVFCMLLTLVPGLVGIWLGVKKRNIIMLLLAALIVSSQNFVFNTVSVMEWPLVLLFSCLYFIVLDNSRESEHKVRLFLLSFAVCFLGSLSRTDFGVLPFAAFIASVILFYNDSNRERVLVSLCGLLGAVVGVCTVSIHTYIFTGKILQSSARMKLSWGKHVGVSFSPVFGRLREILSLELPSLNMGLSQPVKLLLVLLTGAVVSIFLCRSLLVLWNHRFENQRRALRRHSLAVLSAALTLSGYALLYCLNSSALQAWYTANLIVPVFVIALALGSVLATTGSKAIVSFCVIIMIIGNIFSLYPLNSPLPHQRMMYKAGRYLSEDGLEGKAASWNAGIIGYYQGGSVINLDGLVNDGVHDYIAEGKLAKYLKDEEIRYVMDFDVMLTSEFYRKRGGYNSQAINMLLRPVKTFPPMLEGWNMMTLYKVGSSE